MKQKKSKIIAKKESKKVPNDGSGIILYIRRHPFQLVLLLLMGLAAFLRFYHFQDRWGIGDDSTRDIAIARQALARHEWPLIGSFSSAGPFTFGPLFYWVLMFSYIIFPFWFTAPVILTVLASIITVGALIACGYYIEGKRLAIIIGILATTAPQLVARSIAIGQHSYIAITTSLLFLFFVLYWKKKNLIYAFLMGIAVGAAISFHYQAINLLIFFGAVLFVPGMSWLKRISGLLLMGLGFIIPSLPLIIWDSQQQWANVRNLLDYFLVGQYRLYVPNSWRLFIFTYLPSYWSMVVGGYNYTALLLMIFSGIVVLISMVKKKISYLMVMLAVIFGILLLVNKSYRGERSEGYLIYLAPFILLFTAWSINRLFEITGKLVYTKVGKIAAYILLVLILIGNTVLIVHYEASKNIKPQLATTIQYLTKKYPNTKFVVYDYKNRQGFVSQPLGLFLSVQGKTDPHGMPIGFTCNGGDCPHNLPQIADLNGMPIVNMKSVADRDQKSSGWVKTNPENMYDDLIGWSKTHSLKATFNPGQYLEQKLHLK